MKLYSLLFIVLISNYSQAQSWVELKDPQAGILGHGVVSLKNGDVALEPFEQLDDPKIDVYQSADFIEDYTNKYRKFITLFTTAEKWNISHFIVYKASIKSINAQDVAKMKSNVKYIYEGYSADSMELTISRKREVNIDYGKAVKSIFNAMTKSILTGAAVTKIADVLPVLDSIRSEKKDSIIYTCKIKSPNVFFKVKAIKFIDFVKHDWDSYIKYFDNLKTKVGRNGWIPDETKDLKLDALNMETLSQYPEFWGANDITTVRFKFGLRKKQGEEIKLYVLHTENVVKNSVWIPMELEPTITDEHNLRHWNMDRLFVYSFNYSGIRKYIYVSIIADQVDANTIRITNWVRNGKKYEAKTFMKYPEMKFAYVNE
jgi:hypothetical protein